MVRLYGRALRGQRARDAAPHGHWGVRTLIGALFGDGRTACMSIDAATDGEIFYQYVVRVLLPELRPGDIVVLDNLRSHKQQRVTDAIGAAGCRLEYLPPTPRTSIPSRKCGARSKPSFGSWPPGPPRRWTKPSVLPWGASRRRMQWVGWPRAATIFLKKLYSSVSLRGLPISVRRFCRAGSGRGR